MDKPGILKMIRAPFLSSIITPLLAGTLLAAGVGSGVYLPGLLMVLIIGIGLHAAVNVYNDIYDTIQGTDRVNVHRNEASGGSGILQDHPSLMGRMFQIARASLLIALAGTLVLAFLVSRDLLPLLGFLYVLSAFFSKYYTAPPVKLAYRGMGEVSVWFAFGPMAVMLASVGQDLGWHPQIGFLMPATGLSTLSILLVGQLIDLDADRQGGKRGVASRLGTRFTSVLYLLVQLGIVANIVLLYLYLPTPSWPVLLALIPYLFVFPVAAAGIVRDHGKPGPLKKVAKLTVLLHLLFSFFLVAGLLFRLL